MISQKKHQIPKELLPYYTHHRELMYHEDIFLENRRIIVLDTLHPEMKSIIINDILDLKI